MIRQNHRFTKLNRCTRHWQGYRVHMCGLCHALGDGYGQLSRLLTTREMMAHLIQREQALTFRRSESTWKLASLVAVIMALFGLSFTQFQPNLPPAYDERQQKRRHQNQNDNCFCCACGDTEYCECCAVCGVDCCECDAGCCECDSCCDCDSGCDCDCS